LTLVATPIGNLGDLSPRAAAALAEADVIACEDTRHTRKLLSHLGVPAGGRLVAVHDHNEAASVGAVLRLLDEGRHVVLVSDAGTPAISDPGHRLVAAATAAGATVDAVPGPNAAITALVVSGLPTDRFCFEGFLPRRGRERAARLAGIAAEGRTTVLYEAPTRVRSTVADLAEVCGGLRQVAIARELTKLYEEVWRGSLAAATEHLDSDGQEPRGEHVIVVAGAPPAGEASQAAVEQLVGDRLAAGQSTRDVAGAVATELGVPRRQAYETALRLERESAEQGGKRESPAGGTRVGR
jgi:16S rRNA (cytidine1402-2'-O)-methyltransferase